MSVLARHLEPFLDQAANGLQWLTDELGSSLQITIKEGPDGRWTDLEGRAFESAAALSDTDLTVILDESHFLLVDLTLPIAAKSYIDDIVASRIDLITPWTRENALFGVTLISETATTVTVLVAASSKEILNQKIDQLTRMSPRTLTIRLTARAKSAPKIITLPIANGKTRSPAKQRTTLKELFFGSLAAAGFLIVVAALSTTYLNAEHERLQSQIRSLRATLTPQSSNEAVIRDPIARMADAKRNQWPMVDLLAQLAAILPDDTYLDTVDLTLGELRIEGQSQQVAELPKVIGENKTFSKITFTAPTVKREGQRGDLFELSIKIAHRGNTVP